MAALAVRQQPSRMAQGSRSQRWEPAAYSRSPEIEGIQKISRTRDISMVINVASYCIDEGNTSSNSPLAASHLLPSPVEAVKLLPNSAATVKPYEQTSSSCLFLVMPWSFVVGNIIQEGPPSSHRVMPHVRVKDEKDASAVSSRWHDVSSAAVDKRGRLTGQRRERKHLLPN